MFAQFVLKFVLKRADELRHREEVAELREEARALGRVGRERARAPDEELERAEPRPHHQAPAVPRILFKQCVLLPKIHLFQNVQFCQPLFLTMTRSRLSARTMTSGRAVRFRGGLASENHLAWCRGVRPAVPRPRPGVSTAQHRTRRVSRDEKFSRDQISRPVLGYISAGSI